MNTYGLLGKKLGHSFSEKYFSAKFINENIHAEYINFEVANDGDLELFLQNTQATCLNITIPYKEKILPFIDFPDEIVQKIGATNCIKKINNQWHATNTDCLGFESTFLPHLQPHHNKAMVFGRGGAAKAVQYVLKKNNIPYILVNRSFELGGISYMDIDAAIMERYTILINTTPLGMHPNILEAPPIPYYLISSQHYVYDLVYNPTETEFLKRAKKQNAFTKNGLDMLHAQADAAWNYWQTR